MADIVDRILTSKSLFPAVKHMYVTWQRDFANGFIVKNLGIERLSWVIQVYSMYSQGLLKVKEKSRIFRSEMIEEAVGEF